MNPFDSAFCAPTNTAPLSPLPFAFNPSPLILTSHTSPADFNQSALIVFDEMPLRRTSNHIPSDDLEQGIVTILAADSHAKAASIRRTLSADMSSKKWLNQNGFFPIKKDEEFNQSPNQDEVWRSIQAENAKNPPRKTGVWGQILTQKSDDSVVQPPYVHPMVKRSRSSMSEKSLEVCTESLGSETGSDCFSDPELGDEEELIKRREQQQGVDQDENLNVVVKFKKSPPPRNFPPPLPSIDGGASVQMHSRRENGRLVLEAVSVAPRNYFHANREDGRLLLTLKNHAPAEEAAAPPPEEETGEKGVGKEESLVVEQNLSVPTGMISVHKSMRKLMTVGNYNITPSKCGATAKNPGFIDGFSDGTETVVAYRRFADVGKVGDVFPTTEARQSLPPRPPTPPAAVSASSLNAYEYFWRSKPFMTSSKSSKKMDQDLVLYMRGCKEGRRSLFWQPYCIATS
ncbi:protein FAF-like, chloroplastic [Salvia hispanica]|uniref:protein FAF-like, chloroplastic n=1 Tax=Salvia hispanica TaxID=49212 RepID=UPI0020098519|nr:protein FAF-like, chloroplastic [Salvia hispanica]